VVEWVGVAVVSYKLLLNIISIMISYKKYYILLYPNYNLIYIDKGGRHNLI